MKVKLVFDDWRQNGNSDSIYDTELGVHLSSGDLHSGTLFDANLKFDELKFDEELENQILLYWKKYQAYPVFRVMPNENA